MSGVRAYFLLNYGSSWCEIDTQCSVGHCGAMCQIMCCSEGSPKHGPSWQKVLPFPKFLFRRASIHLYTSGPLMEAMFKIWSNSKGPHFLIFWITCPHDWSAGRFSPKLWEQLLRDWYTMLSGSLWCYVPNYVLFWRVAKTWTILTESAPISKVFVPPS